MPGRILIVDTVATNRVVLKAKMLARHFAVDACGSNTDAQRMIAQLRPDLILINLADPNESRHAFCKQLRNTPETNGIAIVAIDVADTAMARFAALDAGADDVLPHPMNDTLLLARIRSLLRVHSAVDDLVLRESTSRALGFDEQKTEFQTAACVDLLTETAARDSHIQRNLSKGLSQKINVLKIADVLRGMDVNTVPDLIVFDAVCPTGTEHRALFDLLPDLRSRAATRAAAQLVVVPDNTPELAAIFFDLGADDVVPQNCDIAELTLRARALIRRKRNSNQMALNKSAA